jgi:hypothetical protein
MRNYKNFAFKKKNCQKGIIKKMNFIKLMNYQLNDFFAVNIHLF